MVTLPVSASGSRFWQVVLYLYELAGVLALPEYCNIGVAVPAPTGRRSRFWRISVGESSD